MTVEPFSSSRKLVVHAIDEFLGTLIRAAQRVFCGRLASLRVAAGAIIVALLTYSPAYNEFGNWLSNSRNTITQAMSIKVKNPLSPIPSALKEAETHNDKMELRLTVPVLGYLSGTGMWTVVIWNHLAGLAAFLLLPAMARKALKDELGGALFVLGIGATTFGSTFFNDLVFGDGVAFLFTILSVATGSTVISLMCFVAAAFCDERAVAAMPLLLLYLTLRHGGEAEKGLRRRLCIAILLGAGTWWLLRVWIESAFHLTMGAADLATRVVVRDNVIQNLPYVFLNVFKASWILPIFAISSSILRRKWRFSLAFAGASALAIAPAFLVQDFDRSVCYAFMILPISLYFLAGDIKASRKFLAGVFVANLLLISPWMSILRVLYKVFAGFGRSS